MSFAAHAAPNWYYGKVKRISMYAGGFVMTFESTALDDCLYKYVYFQSNSLGDKTVDRALSLALAAQAGDKTVGVVIDKTIYGTGGQCNCTGSMDIKD
ncbi:MAG: hypothetical protein AAF385_12360 [Pseudomonadota bacterium]